MKRSGPPKRNGINLKKTQRGWNSTLSPTSKQQRKTNRDVRELPVAGTCQRLQCSRLATDTHEIVGGPLRTKCRKLGSCVLRLCRLCHTDGPDPVQYWRKSRQLALKMHADPESFNLDEFNELVKGWVVQQVTMNEVLSWSESEL